MAEKTYKGCTEIPRLLREYVEKRQTNQSEIARAINRAQATVSTLMGGWWRRTGESEIFPYFGMKEQEAGENLLLIVAAHLRIPQSKVTRAYQEDMLAWSVEKARRAMAKGRKTASR